MSALTGAIGLGIGAPAGSVKDAVAKPRSLKSLQELLHPAGQQWVVADPDQERLAQLDAEMTDPTTPGAALGGTGATGILASDFDSYQALQARQKEYANLKRAANNQDPLTETFRGTLPSALSPTMPLQGESPFAYGPNAGDTSPQDALDRQQKARAVESPFAYGPNAGDTSPQDALDRQRKARAAAALAGLQQVIT